MHRLGRKILACKKLPLLALILAASFYSQSDAYALGKVSRNCNPLGAQESITTDYCGDMAYGICGNARYWLYARSHHFDYNSSTAMYVLLHSRDSGWAWGELLNAWRARAGDWFEILSGGVWGEHWWYDPNVGIVSFLGDTIVQDCNATQWGLEHQL